MANLLRMRTHCVVNGRNNKFCDAQWMLTGWNGTHYTITHTTTVLNIFFFGFSVTFSIAYNLRKTCECINSRKKPVSCADDDDDGRRQRIVGCCWCVHGKIQHLIVACTTQTHRNSEKSTHTFDLYLYLVFTQVKVEIVYAKKKQRQNTWFRMQTTRCETHTHTAVAVCVCVRIEYIGSAYTRPNSEYGHRTLRWRCVALRCVCVTTSISSIYS